MNEGRNGEANGDALQSVVIEMTGSIVLSGSLESCIEGSSSESSKRCGTIAYLLKQLCSSSGNQMICISQKCRSLGGKCVDALLNKPPSKTTGHEIAFIEP